MWTVSFKIHVAAVWGYILHHTRPININVTLYGSIMIMQMQSYLCLCKVHVTNELIRHSIAGIVILVRYLPFVIANVCTFVFSVSRVHLLQYSICVLHLEKNRQEDSVCTNPLIGNRSPSEHVVFQRCIMRVKLKLSRMKMRSTKGISSFTTFSRTIFCSSGSQSASKGLTARRAEGAQTWK